jgi:hypothetical protein
MQSFKPRLQREQDFDQGHRKSKIFLGSVELTLNSVSNSTSESVASKPNQYRYNRRELENVHSLSTSENKLKIQTEANENMEAGGVECAVQQELEVKGFHSPYVLKY